jgi:hypothetical protein
MTDIKRPEEEAEESETEVEAHSHTKPQTPPIIYENETDEEDDDVEAHSNSKPQTPPIISRVSRVFERFLLLSRYFAGATVTLANPAESIACSVMIVPKPGVSTPAAMTPAFM